MLKFLSIYLYINNFLTISFILQVFYLKIHHYSNCSFVPFGYCFKTQFNKRSCICTESLILFTAIKLIKLSISFQIWLFRIYDLYQIDSNFEILHHVTLNDSNCQWNWRQFYRNKFVVRIVHTQRHAHDKTSGLLFMLWHFYTWYDLRTLFHIRHPTNKRNKHTRRI